MDVLVRWSDGSQHVVFSDHLKFKPPLELHRAVKMRWGKVWWKGTVVDFENSAGKLKICTYLVIDLIRVNYNCLSVY